MNEENTQDYPATPQQQQQAAEKNAFVRHVQDSGEQIPSNFENAEAWFDSLKNAQAQYTQGQQELANLKKEYNENGATNPNYQPEETQVPAEEPVLTVPEDVSSLQIEAPTEGEETEAPDMERPAEVSVAEWNDWGNIIDASGGQVPDSLRNAIKMRLNVDDKIIDDYMQTRQSVQAQHVESAATLVGGQQELAKIMSWAGKNLTEEERGAINGQLSGPGYKTAVLGLKARYESSDNTSVARAKEPGATPNRSTSTNLAQGVMAYASEQEMFADQRNPKYRTDPKFRQAVEQRIIVTQTGGFRS